MKLSGPFQYVGSALEVLRMPVRWLMNRWKKYSPYGQTALAGEESALDKARRDMMESLQIATASRRSRHRFWQELSRAMETEARGLIEPAYQKLRDRQRRQFADKLAATTRSADEQVQKRPYIARTLQGLRGLADLGAIIAVVYYVGFNVLSLVAAPLAIGAIDLAIQAGAWAYIRRHRDDLVRQQKENVRELVQSAYIDSLLVIPRSMGSQFQSLAKLAARLPIDLEQLTTETLEGDGE